jgi:integrase/recombinase XerD
MGPTPIEIFVRHAAGCQHKANERYKRCDCPKHIRWSQDGKQIRRATRSRTWAGAERFKRSIEQQYEGAVLVGPLQSEESTTIERGVALYVQDKKSQNLEDVTLAKIERTTKRLLEFVAEKNRCFTREITAADLTEYRATWGRWYKSSQAAANEQSRLKAFFRYCHRSGIIARDPAASMSAIKVDRLPVLPFEPEEMGRILEAVPQCKFKPKQAARVRALILLMRWSGLSIMDAVTLGREKLRYANGDYRVVTRRCKTGVVVNNLVPDWVGEELVSVSNSNPDFFFFSGAGQPKSAVSYFQRLLQKVFEKAGLPAAHPHMLRHTAAIEMLKARKDMRAVSKFLGHKSILTTEKYYSTWNLSQQDILDNDVRSVWQRMQQGNTRDE